MFKNKKIFVLFFLFSFTFLFVGVGLALAVAPTDVSFQLVPCEGTLQSPCDYVAFIRGVNNLINYMIALAIPLAAVAFAWAGFKYLTAGGDSGQVQKAHDIFKKVLTGFIIVLAGWLIVQTITSVLLDPQKPGFQKVLKQQ